MNNTTDTRPPLTIKTIELYTPQEIFDYVAAHLLKQNAKAIKKVNGELSCCYRTNHGNACAIGCMMPEGLYDPIFEGLGVTQLIKAHIIPNHSLFLLKSLQNVHDRSSPTEWPMKLTECAAEFNLTFKLTDNEKATPTP